MAKIEHLYSVLEALVMRWLIDEPVIQVLTEIDVHQVYQHFDLCHNLGEYPRCWRKAKRQCPELVYGVPSLKSKTSSVTSVDGYVKIGIHKIDGSDPGISRERSLNAFRSLHREVGNL